MLWPLLACFVLVGIHAYLGFHVLARKVIFVDLALAQIAALGAVYGVFIGLSLEIHSWAIKGISVLFTLLGALLISFTRSSDERVPHEAVIGIIYAAALSLMVLLTASLPHGADEVRQMLAGSILWVSQSDVIYIIVLYAFVGFIHIMFRRQFFALSSDAPSSYNRKWWDFLFYALFGVVVTSSVSIGGVLLVFGFLIIPSVIGVLLATSIKWRLIIGWLVGGGVSFLGVVLAHHLDLPSGPTIVILLASLLIVIAVIVEIRRGSRRTLGFKHVLLVLMFLAIPLVTPIVFEKLLNEPYDDHEALLHVLTHDGDDKALEAALKSTRNDEIIRALERIKGEDKPHYSDAVRVHVTSTDIKVRELAMAIVTKYQDRAAAPRLEKIAAQEKDPFLIIEIAETLLSLGERSGITILANLIAMKPSEFVVDDAITHIQAWVSNAPAVTSEVPAWLEKMRARIVFNKESGKFSSQQ